MSGPVKASGISRTALPVVASIAWRNVLRHGKRTLITAIVLTVGIGIFILFDSMLAGMDRITIDTGIEYENASVSIRTKEYQQHANSQPLEYALADPEAIMKKLPDLLPPGSTFTPRSRFYTQVSNYTDDTPGIAIAVDPQKDPSVFRTSSSIVSGEWVSPGKAVLGSDMARDLRVKVGDWVAISAILPDSTINAIEIEVGGIADLPLFGLSSQAVYLSLADAEALAGSPLPLTEIDILIPPAGKLDRLVAQAETAAASIESAFAGIEALSIGEAMKDYLAMRTMKSKFSYVVIFIVLLIAAVGIFNTLLMSMYSRIREIGVLAAYGLEPGQIKRLFSLEGLMIGAIGSLGGLALGALFVWWLNTKGISFEGIIGNLDLGSLPKNLYIRGEWNAPAFAGGFIFGVLVSWLASLMPARKAASIEVTDALRFV